jgi:chromosome segregation ATPase
MTIEITKGSENPVAEFFSSPSNTPEIDEVEKYSGVTIKDSVTTCGDESSSVYIPVIFARKLERERNNARKDAAQLADRLSGLELRTTEELAKLERERNEWSAMCGERDKVKTELEMWRDGNIMHQIHRDELEKAERERNEAQKELSSIHQWIDRNDPDGFIDSQTYFQNLERFVDNWYDRLDRLEVDAKRFVRERDEAREALREAWLAMDEVDGTDRMVNWQNKNASILEGAK